MSHANDVPKNALGIDIGSKRIGVAICSYTTKLPQPLVTLPNDGRLIEALKAIIKDNNVDLLVVGLPRNLNGNETSQTALVKEEADKLKKELNLQLVYQDEALSSVRAEEDLKHFPDKFQSKGDVDKLAACYILEDYLA